METMEMKDLICKALSDKLGQNITILNVEHLTTVTEHFVICDARSSTQVKALGANVEHELTSVGIEPLHKDGYSEGRWVVLDYGSVIVHIFNDTTRVLYALEKLWSDGKNVEKYGEEKETNDTLDEKPKPIKKPATKKPATKKPAVKKADLDKKSNEKKLATKKEAITSLEKPKTKEVLTLEEAEKPATKKPLAKKEAITSLEKPKTKEVLTLEEAEKPAAKKPAAKKPARKKEAITSLEKPKTKEVLTLEEAEKPTAKKPVAKKEAVTSIEKPKTNKVSTLEEAEKPSTKKTSSVIVEDKAGQKKDVLPRAKKVAKVIEEKSEI